MPGVELSLLSKAHQRVRNCGRSLPMHVANYPIAPLIQEYATAIFQLLYAISQDANRSEGLLRACMGVLG